MKIFIGADHKGFSLKEKIVKWLVDWSYEYEDLGASSFDPKDDYTTFASLVASMVADNKNSRGVLLCGSGVGVDIVANKFDGVRASIGKSPEQVRAGRKDDNMNVLVIAADYTEESEAKKILKAFLETKFEQKSRHKKRLADIAKIEANN